MDYDTTLFPYYANCDFEPFVPTAEQIDAFLDSKDVRDKRLRVPEYGSQERSWRMGPYNIRVEPYESIFQEAENLLYLERNSTVRTPKLYAAFKKERVDPFFSRANEGLLRGSSIKPSSRSVVVMNYYMVTEYLEGFQDGDTTEWAILDAQRQLGRPVMNEWWKRIGDLLGEQLRKLRSVPPEDPNHYGRINGQRFMETEAPYMFCTDDSRGPFKYEELVERIIQHARSTTKEKVLLSLLPRIEAKLLEVAGSPDAAPVLTTTDCMDGDYVVRFTRDENNKPIGIEEVVLIRWDHLAWMPPWYEAGELYLRRDALGRSALKRMSKVNMDTAACFAEYGQNFWIKNRFER